jgi:hypothetical protein
MEEWEERIKGWNNGQWNAGFPSIPTFQYSKITKYYPEEPKIDS